MIDRLLAFLPCLILEGAGCFAKSLVVLDRRRVSRFQILLFLFDSFCFALHNVVFQG